MKPAIKYALAGVWLIFTTALTIWWYIFSQAQLARLLALSPNHPEEIQRSKKMLELEGGVLIASLVLGGLALIYLIYRDARQNRRIREFFRNFAHELKTPIGSLRLQAEALKEDLKDSASVELAQRIVTETERLNLQLENSLLLAQLDSYQTLPEQLDLRELARELKLEWSDLSFSLTKNCSVNADLRALQSILRNLVQNAVVHGRATEITLTPEENGATDMVTISIRDNGQGFGGKIKDLGRPLQRHYSGSGSGIGLHLASCLVKKMKGSLEYNAAGPGFEVLIKLPLKKV